MKEIGGYMGMEQYHLPMLHDGMLPFNCARNCLAYLIEKKHIKTIYIPRFLCDSVSNVCKRYQVEVQYYSIGLDFLPKDLEPKLNSWVYIVNYYGQISNSVLFKQKEKYEYIIVDNVQAYFQEPVEGVDTIYTCRKFLGVTDGAFLYSNIKMDEAIPMDESFERTNYLLGRFERNASEFYYEYTKRELEFDSVPVRKMSKLTNNLLHSIDYNTVAKKRTDNFYFLHSNFSKINKLNLVIPKGAYMYPLYIENGEKIRCKLQKEKIFIPTLWPNVLKNCESNTLEYDMAENILPLPVDQRYSKVDMEYMLNKMNAIMGDLL